MNVKFFIAANRLTKLSLTLLALAMIFCLTLQPLPVTATPQVVFSNAAPIAINTLPLITGTPYPSTIDVTGMTGTISKVTVTLNNLTHTRPGDLDMLLVSPTGTKYIFMSDAIFHPVSNITLTLDSQAATTLPPFAPNFGGGTFRPANYPGGDLPDEFPAPALLPPYLLAPTEGTTTFLSAFNGANPNGTWSLYVVDDMQTQGGSIAGGWTLNVTTTGTPATNFSNAGAIAINDNLPIVATASPYPSIINVSGLSCVITNLKVTVNNLSHPRAKDIDILLVTPNGMGMILMSDSGASSAINATITFDDAAPQFLPSGGPITGGTFKPTNNFDNDAGGLDPFLDPAPPGPYVSALVNLNGFSPNGAWRLFVVDDAGTQAGSIAGGWSLDITTGPYTPPTLGCASPTFASAANFSLTPGADPAGLAHGDFNNDSKQDLVTANQVANNIAVMLCDGTGGFGSPTYYAAGNNPYAVAVSNFNGDGNQDIAVVNSSSNSVQTFIGNGAGAFTSGTSFTSGPSPISLAAGDFNNDAKPDLAVANFGGFFPAGTVTVALGLGTPLGDFSPPVQFAARTQPSFVAVGNFNADTNLDLAVANFRSNNLSILLGTGTGSFTAAPDVSTGSWPVSIAVGDFNADAKQDLAVANLNSNNLTLLFGSGTGTFSQTTQPQAAGSGPVSVTTADFNGDARLDLAVAYRGANEVRVLLNNGAGNFGSTGAHVASYAVGSVPSAVIAADFNGNGQPDLAVANTGSDNISVLVNSCAVSRGNRFDFDGDRRTDFSVFRPSNTTWFIQRSSDNAALGRVFGNSTDILVPADYNGDGVTEIGYYRPGTGVWAIPSHLLFSNSISFYFYYIQFGISTDIPIPADFDGDARADLNVFRPSDGFWYQRLSTDNSERSIPFGISEDKPVPADYDGDGKADVAVFRPSNGTWYIFRSSDSQVYAQPFGTTGDRPVQADYDGDGKADIAVFRPSDGSWYILKSSDNGVLGYSWGVSTDIPVPGDYDSDGKFDVAVWRPSNGVWYVLRSSDGGTITQAWGTNGDIPVPSAQVP
jgi:subtilisin-like proprotein convertase family protein